MTDFLAIYLRDHHAAAQAGVALAKRASSNVDVPASLSVELAAAATEIEEDLCFLDSVMAALDIEVSSTKDMLAAAAERLARLKTNGRLVDRSPLSDVVELEALCSGILAKESLWRSLSLSDRELPAELDLDRLIGRAEQQRELVERCKTHAARVAFKLVPSRGG